MTDGLYGADRETILTRLDQLEGDLETLRDENAALRERIADLEQGLEN